MYNAQLMTKALLLSASIKIRERIMNSTDEQLKNQPEYIDQEPNTYNKEISDMPGKEAEREGER